MMPLTPKELSIRLRTWVYRVKDCCDVADCDNALRNLREFADRNEGKYTPAMLKRLCGLTAAKDRLTKSGKF
jgi:hypothetical protein